MIVICVQPAKAAPAAKDPQPASSLTGRCSLRVENSRNTVRLPIPPVGFANEWSRTSWIAFCHVGAQSRRVFHACHQEIEAQSPFDNSGHTTIPNPPEMAVDCACADRR